MTTEVEYFGGDPGRRSWLRALGRGLRKKCPQCGRGRLFSGYTTTAETCPSCELHLAGHQADDAPPYITTLVVGHLAIPLALASKQLFDPPLWLQFGFWGPVMLIATFWFLPISKGAMIGLQWANRMHGFGEPAGETPLEP